MQEQLMLIKENALKDLNNLSSTSQVEEIRIKYLGKKGELTTILRSMGGLSKEERPVFGKLVNEVKAEVEAKLEKVALEVKVNLPSSPLAVPNS